jgi:hypothetical protein
VTGTTILFDPLPVGRIGVHRDSHEVVIASDFSTFAWMIEEFVSLGVCAICIGKSAPESRLVTKMPPLLRRRITLANDEEELRARALIMEPIHEEVGCRVVQGSVKFDRKTKDDLKAAIIRVHRDLYALAVGLNHGVQVNMHPARTIAALHYLRGALRDPRGRSVATQLSGVMAAYVPVTFDGPQITATAPTELVNIFDQLVNEESYSGFSNSIGSLTQSKGRKAALARARTYLRRIIKSPPAQVIVDTISKIVKVGGANAIPQASSLFSMFQGRALPMLLDLSPARSQALNRWLATAGSAPPFSSEGRQLNTPAIDWLPPLQSASADEPGSPHVSMGRVGELIAALTAYNGDGTGPSRIAGRKAISAAKKIPNV